ncbi:MAG: 30S ribosomal protein S9 [Chloroflexi bacterium]|nr:30S ribosomal protein S9 [Chloroflexota bacterium]
MKERERGERAATARKNQFGAVGRRKTSIAQVLLQPGAGHIVVNGKPLEEYLPRPAHQTLVTLPLRITNTIGNYNVVAKAAGGGITGQAGALAHGIARALVKAEEETHKPVLRQAGLLTRDPRVKERKKPGLKRARKAPQYTKR